MENIYFVDPMVQGQDKINWAELTGEAQVLIINGYENELEPELSRAIEITKEGEIPVVVAGIDSALMNHFAAALDAAGDQSDRIRFIMNDVNDNLIVAKGINEYCNIWDEIIRSKVA